MLVLHSHSVVDILACCKTYIPTMKFGSHVDVQRRNDRVFLSYHTITIKATLELISLLLSCVIAVVRFLHTHIRMYTFGALSCAGK